jgi:choline dehydrogenase-like flavoprotein
LNGAVAAVWGDRAVGVPLTRDGAGRRVSVNDAYLEPARSRSNLHISGDTLVDRVLFAGRRAVGVRTATGDEVEADVVVVSAGAIHSPALLLRSGVDTDGVGEGLQDHPSFPIAIARREAAEVRGLPIATLARLPGAEGVDDLQVLPMEYVDAAMPGLALVMAAAMRVHGRGRVTLAGNDPAADPEVDFDLLADDRDAATVQLAIDAVEQLLDHPAFRAVGEALPYDRSDAGVRATVGDYVHAAGTCAMGTVVDTSCRVRGHHGLMVCDASVLPVLPRANTHLPTVMVAERVAALTLARFDEGV